MANHKALMQTSEGVKGYDLGNGDVLAHLHVVLLVENDLNYVLFYLHVGTQIISLGLYMFII